MAVTLPVELSGVVKRYKGNGRKLGYPTANISTPTTLADGVYFGHASLVGYKGQAAIIFIGTPTTVGDSERRVEAHLLGVPDRDYYGETLTLVIEKFHRLNQTFANVQELVAAMKADEVAGRNWATAHPTRGPAATD